MDDGQQAGGDDTGGSQRYPVGADSVTGWVRLQMTTGLRTSGEIVADLTSGEPVGGFDIEALPGRDEVVTLVGAVAQEHRAQQPEPSADARAVIAAAGALFRAGVIVRLGEEADTRSAREAVVARGVEARQGGALVAGCAYASHADLERMVLDGRLELSVATLPVDEQSAFGEQVAQGLGLQHASAATLGQHVVDAFVGAGLPARWDGMEGSPVVIEPIAFAAPLED